MKLTTAQIGCARFHGRGVREANGQAGELLVQEQLLLHGIESAPTTTDTGIDLVAYSPPSGRRRDVNGGCILMGRDQMRDEYDFSNGVRGRFFQPNEPKHYVITLDHRPKVGRFEVYTDENGAYRYRVKTETGTVLISNGPYDTRRDALEALEELRETVIGAETVEAS